MSNLLIIDNENSKYLVRPTLLHWVVDVGYSKPRKSSKGYVGSKWILEDKKEFLPDYEANAIEMFEKYKDKYEKQIISKEIVGCSVSCSPIIKYYVTCPVCGKDAEIISWLMMLDSEYGEEMMICCEHCSQNKDFFFNKVGVCYDTSFFDDRQELRFSKEVKANNITWEDWENNKGEKI